LVIAVAILEHFKINIFVNFVIIHADIRTTCTKCCLQSTVLSLIGVLRHLGASQTDYMKQTASSDSEVDC
jgi:hypothetical protein